MAAKLAESVGRKPKPIERTIKAAARGYVVVDGEASSFYGFLASDPQEEDSWDDPTLRIFRTLLNRLGNELGLLKGFKP